MRHATVAVLLALSGGIAFAGEVTPYDKELAAQMLYPKKAMPKAEQAQPSAPTVATTCSCKR